MIYKRIFYPLARWMQGIFEIEQDKALFDATAVFLGLLIINNIIMLVINTTLGIFDIDNSVIDLLVNYLHIGLIIIALLAFGHLYPGSTWKSFLAGIFGFIVMGWENIPRSEIPYRTITLLGGILMAVLPGPISMLAQGCIADYFLVVALAMVFFPLGAMLLWLIGKFLKFIIIDIEKGDDYDYR